MSNPTQNPRLTPKPPSASNPPRITTLDDKSSTLQFTEGELQARLAGLVSRLSTDAPEGYEEDWAKAHLILKAIEEGSDWKRALEVPKKWREKFLALSYFTEMPPTLCARKAGITLAWLRHYLTKIEDEELVEAVSLGRVANFESRIDHPSPRDLRSPAIPMAGLTALANWGIGNQAEQSVSSLEIEKAIQTRKQLHLAIELEDEKQARENEEARAVSNESFGVLGLATPPLGYKPE